MFKRLLNKQFLCNTGAKISRSARPLFFFRGRILMDTIVGVGNFPQERVVARRVRPNQRWDAAV
jgi:hypothetical protein